MCAEASPGDSNKSAKELARIPWIVRIDGIVMMVVALMVLFGYARDWISNFSYRSFREDILFLFVLTCLFLAGLALVRGKRYGVVCLAAGVVGWLIAIVHFLLGYGLTWGILAMLLPGIVFG